MAIRPLVGFVLGSSLVATLTVVGCRGDAPRNPVAPSSVVVTDNATAIGVTNQTAGRTAFLPDSRIGAMDVVFPPRNEPFDFRNRLETKYRDGLRRGPGPSFVDMEGGAVWVQEYLRYRLNRCSHTDAVARVFTVIDTQSRTIPAVCGSAPTGQIDFPPRNEPFDFRNRLELKYRDELRSGVTQTSVDNEGDVIWMQEYLRYRLNGCGHLDAVDRVFRIIDNPSVIPPVCVIFTTTTTSVPACSVVARIDGPSGVVNVGDDVSFSGIRSSSTCGAIRFYRWNCGLNAVTNCVSQSATPVWRYPKTGPLGTTPTHTVSLEVEDTAGNRDSATFALRVTQVYGF
jgi:hypothetical protein